MNTNRNPIMNSNMNMMIIKMKALMIKIIIKESILLILGFGFLLIHYWYGELLELLATTIMKHGI